MLKLNIFYEELNYEFIREERSYVVSARICYRNARGRSTIPKCHGWPNGDKLLKNQDPGARSEPKKRKPRKKKASSRAESIYGETLPTPKNPNSNPTKESKTSYKISSIISSQNRYFVPIKILWLSPSSKSELNAPSHPLFYFRVASLMKFPCLGKVSTLTDVHYTTLRFKYLNVL